MSQLGKFFSLIPPIETLTGNAGGAVSSNGGNINIIGDGTLLTVIGDPVTYTLTVTPSGVIGTDFLTDDGNTAIPALNILNVNGGSNIHTVTPIDGDNVLEIHLDDNVSIAGTFDAVGNITTSTGDVVSTLGAGSFATSVTVGNDLHVLAGGADIVGTFELSDLVNGVLEADASGIITSTALTEHALHVGDNSGNISFLTVGDTGQVLQANTTADPDWTTTTYPSTSVIGDILIASANNTITTLAPDTAGYILTDGGVGVAPSWQANPTGVDSVVGGTNINITGTAADPVINLDASLLTMDSIQFNDGGVIKTPTDATAKSFSLQAYDNAGSFPVWRDAIEIVSGDVINGPAPYMDLTLIRDIYCYSDGSGPTPASSIYTALVDGSNIKLKAHDLSSGLWTTFLTLTAGMTPTMDLNTTTTIGTKYIYRADGTDISVSDGGTGASTLTDNGVLYGNGTAAIGAIAEGATGTILVGNTTFPPYFTDTPSVTSLTATTILATTFDTNIAAAGATLSGNTLEVDGTDANIDLILTSKGSGHIVLTGYGAGVLGADASGVIYSDAANQYALQVGDGTSTLDSLALGTAAQILQSGGAGADPSWSTTTYPSTSVIGDILIASANNTITTLAPDTAGYILTDGGVGVAPTWQSDSGMSYIPITTATHTAESNNGYVSNCAGGHIDYTLPSLVNTSIGDIVAIVGGVSASWRIFAPEDSEFYFQSASALSTALVTAYISSNLQFDNVELICINKCTVPMYTAWAVRTSVGNLNIGTV